MHPMLKANARAILWFPGLPDGSAALEAEEMVICIVDAENLKETKKKISSQMKKESDSSTVTSFHIFDWLLKWGKG